MKISSAKLKQIIKEEIERFLKEQSEATEAKIDFEGTTTSIEFLGMETKYDQTETKLRINNGEVSSFGAYDVDDLADKVIAELGDKDEDYYYWFLGDYPDEKQVSKFKRKLEDALEGMGADPERESKARTSYSPENVYEGPSVDAGMSKIEKEKTKIRNKLADKDLDLPPEERKKLRAKLQRLIGSMN